MIKYLNSKCVDNIKMKELCISVVSHIMMQRFPNRAKSLERAHLTGEVWSEIYSHLYFDDVARGVFIELNLFVDDARWFSFFWRKKFENRSYKIIWLKLSENFSAFCPSTPPPPPPSTIIGENLRGRCIIIL